jgi:hypothetical protein
VRAVYPVALTLLLLPALAVLGACGDPFGANQNLILLDSVKLAAVNVSSTGPTAIDLVLANAPSHPEQPNEAGQWDLQVRMSGSTFQLVPNPGSGVYRGAGLVKTTRTLEDPGNAPRASDAYTRTALTVAAGDRFYVQSRQYQPVAGGCGTVPKYGILSVVSVVPDSGVVHLAVKSNQACDDERLGG